MTEMKPRTSILLPVFTFAVLLGAGFFVARGSWFEPSAILGDSLTAPLNESAFFQSKAGGIALNWSFAYPAGLVVGGGLTKGFVGIGRDLTSPPTEKLHLVGNLGISGIIKPNINDPLSGNTGEVLTRTPNMMDWQPQLAWMHIQEITFQDGSECRILFPSCPGGWTEYATIITTNPICLTPSGATYSYGSRVRICNKPF